MNAHRNSSRHEEKGMVAILMAIALVAIIGMASFAIDIGSALVTKAELQNVSDAATLAATRELGNIYKSKGAYTSFKDYDLTSAEQAQVRSKAVSLAAANKAGGLTISVPAGDTKLGKFEDDAFTPTTTGVKAVQVTARREEEANGTVPTMLATVIGIHEIGINANSTAALTPLGTLHKGKGEFPVSIASYWFDQRSCENDRTIRLYPTGDLEGCAGWHTFEEDPPSAARLKTILKKIQNGSFESPETTAGLTYYNFTGGAIAAAFQAMADTYNAKKSGTGDWFVNIPVYQAADCANPNQSRLIVGFAKARVYDVKTAPEKELWAEVNCAVVDDSGSGDIGEGGGSGDYGVLVSSPDMVD